MTAPSTSQVASNAAAPMLRVRVDFLPDHAGGGGSAGHRADLVVPGETPVADVVPELLDVFAAVAGAGPAAGASWKLRLPGGTVADPERGLSAAGVRDGDRLTLVDDPGPTPAPLVVDVADVLAEAPPGVGVSDGPVGRLIAAAATLLVVAGTLAMAAVDAPLAAGVAGLAAAGAAAGLRIALRRYGSAPSVFVLAAQTVVLAAVAGAALTGIPLGAGPGEALGDWRFAAGLVPGAAVSAAGLLILRPADRGVAAAVTSVGAAAAVLAGGAAAHAASVAWLGAGPPAAAPVLACAIVALTVAPGVCVAVAGVRVPRIPAAGEPFPEDPDPAAPVDVIAGRAGRLLDGATAATSAILVAAAAGVAGADGPWAMALAAAVAALCAIQSRGHARTVPSAALALAAAATLGIIAAAQWDAGQWWAAALILAPAMAATALTALPVTRVTPSMRRIAELAEAVAIAVALPLAAVVAGLPDLVSGLLR